MTGGGGGGGGAPSLVFAQFSTNLSMIQEYNISCGVQYSTLLLFPSFLASAASLSFLATISVSKKGREGGGREKEGGREGGKGSDREGKVVICLTFHFLQKLAIFSKP